MFWEAPLAVVEAIYAAVYFVYGAIVGSFLNVVIWRMPRNRPLTKPRSHCPVCKRQLSALENIPLVSILLQRGKCRNCGVKISFRYFWVELLTATVWTLMYLHFRSAADIFLYCLFSTALIASFFIDLELFIIPDQLNTFALFMGLYRDVIGILERESTHAPFFGWLPQSIAGAMVCASIFVFIQILGLALFKKDAMGDGDVKLARAIGAMLPLAMAITSFFMAIAAGAVIGGGLLVYDSVRNRGRELPDEEGEFGENELGPTPMREQLVIGLYYIFFVDLFITFAEFLKRKPAASTVTSRTSTEESLVDSDANQEFAKEVAGDSIQKGEETPEEIHVLASSGVPEASEDALPEDIADFRPSVTMIPFGPYMVLGVFLAIFFGEALIQWYLAWSKLGSPGP